jgi:hypothetical protein
MVMSKTLKPVSFVLALAVLALTILALTTPMVSQPALADDQYHWAANGTVVDQNGRGVPGATVSLDWQFVYKTQESPPQYFQANNGTFGAVTNVNGAYTCAVQSPLTAFNGNGVGGVLYSANVHLTKVVGSNGTNLALLAPATGVNGRGTVAGGGGVLMGGQSVTVP